MVAPLRLTFVSLLDRLAALFVLIGSALRFKGKVYDCTNWLFAFGARERRDGVELGPVLFGFDFYVNRWRFDMELGVFLRSVRFTGTPRRPSTWSLWIARA